LALFQGARGPRFSPRILEAHLFSSRPRGDPNRETNPKPVWGLYQTTGGIVNYQHLHFNFPAEPFQRWHVIEDRSVPRGLRIRHPRQPGEKPDPIVNFGVEELSAHRPATCQEHDPVFELAESSEVGQWERVWSQRSDLLRAPQNTHPQPPHPHGIP